MCIVKFIISIELRIRLICLDTWNSFRLLVWLPKSSNGPIRMRVIVTIFRQIFAEFKFISEFKMEQF